VGRPTQFHDPFNREGKRPGSPGLRATWWLIKAVSLVMLTYLMFAWPWYLDVATGYKALIIAVWYGWICVAFIWWIAYWTRVQKSHKT
jgi:hypothetical protein